MHHTNAAPPRPGDKPALTTSETQNKPKEQTSDRILILKLKHPPGKPRDTITAGRSISGATETASIRIRDTPSPPPRTGSRTQATPRAAHHIQAPAEKVG